MRLQNLVYHCNKIVAYGKETVYPAESLVKQSLYH